MFNGKYQNIVDDNIIEIYDDFETLLDKTNRKTKQSIKMAKYLESQTKIYLEPFKITDGFNKFETWKKIN
jgi:hypothetical protein